jgi:hypothetical protein
MNLPEPPSSDETKQQAKIREAFAIYYWPEHFEQSSLDPVSFIDRVLKDYASYETDIVGEWLEVSMAPVYKTYRSCLQYGLKNGSEAKRAEISKFRMVLELTDSKTRSMFPDIRASNRFWRVIDMKGDLTAGIVLQQNRRRNQQQYQPPLSRRKISEVLSMWRRHPTLALILLRNREIRLLSKS